MKKPDHSAGHNEQQSRFLWIDKQKIEVSENVYQAYHTSSRRERYQRDRDKLHGLWLYSTLDGEETTGEESVYDPTDHSTEQLVVDRVMAEKLHSCIKKLTPTEQQLIHQLFFEGLTLREVAENRCTHLTMIKREKDLILVKLMKFIKSF